jgi:hypothetical protein
MHANEMIWGIELETTIPAHDSAPIGAYHRGLPVPWLFYRLGWPTGWYKGADRHKRYGQLFSANGQTPNWAAIKAKLLDMARKYDRKANDARRA